jgi:hypothetical protein
VKSIRSWPLRNGNPAQPAPRALSFRLSCATSPEEGLAVPDLRAARRRTVVVATPPSDGGGKASQPGDLIARIRGRPIVRSTESDRPATVPRMRSRSRSGTSWRRSPSWSSPSPGTWRCFTDASRRCSWRCCSSTGSWLPQSPSRPFGQPSRKPATAGAQVVSLPEQPAGPGNWAPTARKLAPAQVNRQDGSIGGPAGGGPARLRRGRGERADAIDEKGRSTGRTREASGGPALDWVGGPDGSATGLSSILRPSRRRSARPALLAREPGRRFLRPRVRLDAEPEARGISGLDRLGDPPTNTRGPSGRLGVFVVRIICRHTRARRRSPPGSRRGHPARRTPSTRSPRLQRGGRSRPYRRRGRP